MGVQKIGHFLIAFTLVVFLAVTFLGVSMTMGMEMKDDGTMSGCMFDGQAEICPMTFAEHLSGWQNMFTVIPQKSTVFIQLLALIAAFVIIAFALRRHLLLSLFSYFSERWKFYIRDNPNLPLFDHLRQLFSQGILNPKIYNGAAL
jgi:hypothetical protein